MPTINKFPKWMNEYFKHNTFEIIQTPDNYRVIEKEIFPNIPIKSARQLYEHIKREEAFWTNDVVKNNHIVTRYPNQIKTARTQFENALDSDDEVARQTLLENATKSVCSCTINSTTELAKIFMKYSTEKEQFFQGFERAVTGKPSNSNQSQQRQYQEGFIVGLFYAKAISDLYVSMGGEAMTEFRNAADGATDKINEIMGRVDSDYEDHNQKHIELLEMKKEKYDCLVKEFTDFASSCREEKENLEKTYREHLKLSKPAEYWSGMENKYIESGRMWLAGAIVVTVLAIAMLIWIILRVEPFNLAQWAEGIRTTALITMLITIVMFIIRFTSKMATSSFHLARDAKEREQLTYFYLALIKDSAVQESERHLVISSLFSRADTGLLKGESSPEMPSSSIVVEKMKM